MIVLSLLALTSCALAQLRSVAVSPASSNDSALTCNPACQAPLVCTPSITRCAVAPCPQADPYCALPGTGGLDPAPFPGSIPSVEQNTDPALVCNPPCSAPLVCTPSLIRCVMAPCPQADPYCALPGTGGLDPTPLPGSIPSVDQKPSPVCDPQCKPPLTCVLEEIRCIKLPCPTAVPQCVLVEPSQPVPNREEIGNSTCASTTCGKGMKCVEAQVRCAKAPCPSRAHCVVVDLYPPNSTEATSCATTLCKPGTICIEKEVQCFVPPCPPIVECLEAIPGPTCDEVKLKCSEGMKCGIVNGQPACVNSTEAPTNPIPVLTCASFDCQPGYFCVDGKNGSRPQCVKIPDSNVCLTAKIKCPEGQRCGNVNGNPGCVSDTQESVDSPLTCATVDCREGFVCVDEPIECFAPPCGNGTRPRCVERPVDEICANVRIKCKAGHKCGNVNGQPGCVPDPLFDPTPNCGLNEVFNGCGGCEPTCENRSPMCTMECKPGRCMCLPGNARLNGTCIPFDQCPGEEPSSPITCATVDCRDGYICVDEPIECFVPPCNGTRPRCIERPVDDVCATVRINCLEGHKCGNVNGKPACVIDPAVLPGSSSCAATSCPVGSLCVEETVPCLIAPCPIKARCQISPNSNGNFTQNCSKNEVYNACGGCEPTCDNQNPMCTMDCKPGRCVCAPGTARHNGTCISFAQCGEASNPGTNCSRNEVFNACGGCEPTCENRSPICTLDCKPGRCMCSPGMARHNGKCITFDQCADTSANPGNGTEKCPKNEVFDTCGGCEPTCDNIDRVCDKMCRPGKCVCAPGMARYNGKCVPFDKCSNTATTNSTCNSTEEWSECASQCQETCRGRYEPCMTRPMPAMCQAACVCKPYYKRDKDGKCVHQRECYKSAGCPKNEKWSRCANCEASCGEPSAKECSVDCTSGCQCKPGYKRKDNECVAAELC